MTKESRSKLTAWAALAVAVVIIVLTFAARTTWWAFVDVFFLFMCAFTRLLSVYMAKVSPIASRKLNTVCLVCCVLFVISFVVEYFIMA